MEEAARKSFQEFAETHVYCSSSSSHCCNTHFLPPICSLVLLNCRLKCGDGCCCICNETRYVQHINIPRKLEKQELKFYWKICNF